MNDYGLRWVEVNKKDEVVMKQKFFQTEKALKKFIEKVQEKENFIRLDSTTGI